MHIEPGLLAHAKILFASVSASGVLAAHAIGLFRRPTLILRTVLAAVFFSLFMQSFHLPVGPSELHFVGAMPIYLTLGFVPTLLGFGLGLLVQGLLFEPADLLHLGVNTLSLAVPLMLLHHTVGKRLRTLNVATILKLDAIYYTGVTVMVGLWLSVGEVATPLTAWGTFAASYLAIVAIEPLLTLVTVRLLQRHADRPAMRLCFDLAGRT